jgi:hypothetical protein
LVTNAPSLTSAQEFQLGGYNKALEAKAKEYSKLYANTLIIPYHFNYGYAITTWKA